MIHAWRAIQRVGEDLDLSGDVLDAYLKVASEVHDEMLDEYEEAYDLDSEYFEFLNNEVLSDDRVLAIISETDVPKECVSRMRNSEFDIESSFRESWKVRHRLDEIVDLVMLLKLIADYQSQTGEESVSRDRIQYLSYLTNDVLSDREDHSIKPQKTTLGMLERTGYRYTFRKRDSTVHSSRLSQDRNRLIASELLDEHVDESIDPNEQQPFRLSLGLSGEFIVTRYRDNFRRIDTAESILLREWALCQKKVLQEWAGEPISELERHVKSLNSFDENRNGSVLLTGRTRIFSLDSEGPVMDLFNGVKRANA
ncbi:hypothetical protein [Haloarchaeobius sp. TZWWS8]|uniref:hypothetical protein n=1 Tax=Haloarchaeobius sp. TZWWS8 TaxID=3446121 RepID=UPI003EBC05BF